MQVWFTLCAVVPRGHAGTMLSSLLRCRRADAMADAVPRLTSWTFVPITRRCVRSCDAVVPTRCCARAPTVLLWREPPLALWARSCDVAALRAALCVDRQRRSTAVRKKGGGRPFWNARRSPARAELPCFLPNTRGVRVAHMATGKWRARKNTRLVERVRALWAKAHAHVDGQLWATHVYGHTDHKWNDRADELARRGKGGAPPPTQDGGGGESDDDNDDG